MVQLLVREIETSDRQMQLLATGILTAMNLSTYNGSFLNIIK